MTNVLLKATKTGRYAYPQPHVPHEFFIGGKTYSVPLSMAERVVELGGGKIVSSDSEGTNLESKEGDGKKTTPDSKEKGQNSSPNGKFPFGTKRVPGQPKD